MRFSYYFLIIIFFFPAVSFAVIETGKCSTDGYTVATINGVLTNKDGAVENMEALMKKVGFVWNNQKIKFEFLLNPIHSGGFGDLANTIVQKAFENETVADYDLVEMLKDASNKVKTQKLLLVAHSQGNFYANSFYDVATKQAGGVPAESIGVYGVANPASRVSGDGKWLTSDTDKVIAWVVGNVPFRKIKAPNTHIVLQSGDDFSGHGFSEVYLKYRSKEIVEDIRASLDGLAENITQDEDAPCISPPKITIAHEQQGLVYAVTDPVLNPLGAGTLWTLGAGVKTSIFVIKTGVTVAVGTYHIAVNTAVWSYDTTLAIGKFVGNTVVSAGSFVYDAVTNTFSNGPVASNSATVVLATLPTQTLTQTPDSVTAKTQVVTTTQTQNIESAVSKSQQPQQQPQTVFVFEPKVQAGTNTPKLVFVGALGGGSSPTAVVQSQVLGAQASASGEEEIVDEVVVVVEIAESVGDAVASPTLSAPQCAQTLATDGCLLATTTVRFEWSIVDGADHYLINKNGEFATTTDSSHDITIEDFSDYTFEVIAVDAEGNPSATSTQTVSVATIPIAINEIAWMGTVASTNDEWFEIKNNTGYTIDLSQWVLNAKDNSPHVIMKDTIAPRAYLIFERTDDTVVSDVLAHATTTGALNNTGGDQLTLSRDTVVFDKTPDGAWVAGENSTSSRKTMERYSSRESGTDPENWGTNLGYIKNGADAKENPIEGTPGEQNSVSTLINKGQDITEDFTLTADEERYVIANNFRVSASSTLTIEPGVEIKFYDGWINVQGHIVVSGTPENPVIIDTLSSNQNGGISVGGGYTDTVYQGTNASAALDNVNIKNINYIAAYDNSRLDISNTDLLNSSGGIYALDTAQISISSSSIRNTQDNHAVAGYENSKITIVSSTIANTLDNDAVGVYDGTMSITNTTIDGSPDDGGIYVSSGTLSIASSTIRNISDTGISIYKATSTISNVTIENAGDVGIEIYRGQTTIASTTISDVNGWAGIEVDEGTLVISSSTIKNVSNDGISAYNSTTTISNVAVENGGGDGVGLYGGMTTITDSTISGFLDGTGVLTSLQREGQRPNRTSVPGVVAEISGTEITGNSIGIEMEEGSAIIASDVDIHDNGTSEADDIVVLSIE